MKTHDAEAKPAQRQSATAATTHDAETTPAGAALDEGVIQGAGQAGIDRSPRMLMQRRTLQAVFGPALQRQPTGPEDDEAQPVPTGVNETGMPSQLKAGLESLSGMDMSDVRVHRNSDKPAQLNALAYAQGNDIHLGPGQEQHLPHEAWHVVQQRQGRVRETMQMAGVAVNDDAGLEREADLMGSKALHQTDPIGVRQLMRGPASPAGAVQRVIEIGNSRYTHASRLVGDLYNDVVVPWLEKSGYKTYGIKSQMIEFIRIADARFQNNEEFLDKFGGWLAQRKRKVKGGKEVPVLKKFDIQSMSRPNWPKDMKARLGVRAQDNIRHVIRNATLKNALDIEYKKYQDFENRKKRMIALASAVGVQTDGISIDAISSEIYRVVYLNEANLFSGDGPYNQVIGFAADKMQAYGNELLGYEDLVSPVTVKEAAQAIIATAGKPIVNSATVVADLNQVVDSLMMEYAKFDFVEAEELGDLILDIGLNFGFDLIDGRVQGDQENIGSRQGRLLECEMALRNFINSGGTSGDLLEIYKAFVSIGR